MFGLFRKNSFNEKFVDSPMRDNWYQSSSYFCSSFALITTVDENGETNIGPYQLSFPFEVINDRSWMIISRPTSNTTANIRRTGKCALHHVEFNRKQMQTILEFGYPGQSTAEKAKYNCFTMIDSPTPGRAADDRHPKIIKDAFQVYECTWQKEREFEERVLINSTSAHLLLKIDNILLKESWKQNLEDGGSRMPRMPVTFGFRGGAKFWFAQVRKPFWMPIPDKGPKYEAVHYEANRLDDEVRFTLEASKQLTGIPRPFLRTALKGIIKQAKERGVTEVDKEFVEQLNRERGG